MHGRQEEIREAQQEFASYLHRTLVLMEDADWSRHSDLADASGGDMKAATLALWRDQQRTPDTEAMIAMLKNRYAYFSDESAMANGEDDTRRFMDRADEFKLTSGLLDRLSAELARHNLAAYRAKGWHVVELKDGMGFEVKPEEEGFYIITAEKG